MEKIHLNFLCQLPRNPGLPSRRDTGAMENTRKPQRQSLLDVWGWWLIGEELGTSAPSLMDPCPQDKATVLNCCRIGSPNRGTKDGLSDETELPSRSFRLRSG